MGADPQACSIHLDNLRRAWTGAVVCRHAHFRRFQGGNQTRWHHEMVLILTADHGLAVSGAFVFLHRLVKANDTYVNRAMNMSVTTRVGKDLISSLCTGLLTIGSQFGGTLDEAVMMFSNARNTGLTPREFVNQSRKQNKLSKCNLPSSFLCLNVHVGHSCQHQTQNQECQQPQSPCQACQGIHEL